jgi:N-methylhydantoinase A
MAQGRTMSYTIVVDTGGTFSDLVIANEARVLGLYKADTTPGDVFVGISHALSMAAKDLGTDLSTLLGETAQFVYSTTHATNAILEGKTARTAFLTTEGHPDILLYREGGKDQPLNIAIPYPEPYVPRSLTFEVRERVLSDGSVLRPLDEQHLLGVIERLAELEVEAVGVCLLWSVANPMHETKVEELLSLHLPKVEVTLGHRINRISREYRRASSAVIDASLKRLMRNHLADIERRLRDLGFAGEPLMVTHLSGGVQRMEEACEFPLHAVDSGPALAPVSALGYAAIEPETKQRDLIVVDAGGTSCDVSPTRNGRVVYTREKWLGKRWFGHMTGLPAVDTRSVGAGGGSVAFVDGGGMLHVGPQSAGAVPGPACYGRGGDKPTITDAALVLGYIDPDYFLGGRTKLKEEFARATIDRDVGRPLGISTEAAAAAAIELYTEHMRAFINDISVSQGLDPRETLLVAGGGSAGLNIVEVARELGVRQVVVPSLAAGLSAVGGQYSDIVATFTRGMMTHTDSFDFATVNELIEEIEAEGSAFLARLGPDVKGCRELFCEARYRNQLWEIDLPLGSLARFNGPQEIAELRSKFNRLHEDLFAVSQPDEPVEILAWRGDVRVRRTHPELPSRPARGSSSTGQKTRLVHFGQAALETRIWNPADLASGDTIAGPAIIEEATTTIVIPPGAKAQAKPSHYLIDVGE